MFFKEILDCRIWIWIILSLKLLLQLAEGGPPEQDRQCSGLFLSEEWHWHLNCGPNAPNMGEFIKESKPYLLSTLSFEDRSFFFFFLLLVSTLKISKCLSSFFHVSHEPLSPSFLWPTIIKIYCLCSMTSTSLDLTRFQTAYSRSPSSLLLQLSPPQSERK